MLWPKRLPQKDARGGCARSRLLSPRLQNINDILRSTDLVDPSITREMMAAVARCREPLHANSSGPMLFERRT